MLLIENHKASMRPRGGGSSTYSIIATIVVVWLICFHAEIGAAVDQWLYNEVYGHSFLVFPILALWFFSIERLETSSGPSNYLYLCAASVSVVVWMVGDATSIMLIKQFAAIATLQSLLLFALGSAFLRQGWFVLGLLLFTIPIGEEWIRVLQDLTAGAATALLEMTGFSVWREGFYLHTSSGVYWVAEACAGLKFLVATIFLGYFASYFFFTNWRKRLLFFLFSVVVPIPANALRVYVTVLVGEFFGIDRVAGFDHLVYGWVLFLLVFLLLASVVWRYGDRDLPHPRLAIPLVSNRSRTTAILACVPLILVVWFQYIAADSMYRSEFVPRVVENLNMEREGSSRRYPHFPAANDTFSVFLDNGVEAFVAAFDGEGDGGDLLSTQNKVHAPTDRLVHATVLEDTRGEWARLVCLQDRLGNHRLLMHAFVLESTLHYGGVGILQAQLGQLRRGQGRGGFFWAVYKEDSDCLENWQSADEVDVLVNSAEGIIFQLQSERSIRAIPAR